jgi:hypothetical protein
VRIAAPEFTGHQLRLSSSLAGVDGTVLTSADPSIATRFDGDACLDFGFWGGLAVVFVGGVTFGLLGRWVSQVMAARGARWLMLASPLLDFAAFALRPPLTSIIGATGSMREVLHMPVLKSHGTVERGAP